MRKHKVLFLNRKNWLVSLILIFTLLMIVQPMNSVASELTFSVKTVIPKNQVDKSKTYFDLSNRPEEIQQLEVKITNLKETDILVQVDIGPATTNVNGVVEYGPKTENIDESLKYNLQDILIVTDGINQIQVPGGKTKSVFFTLAYPVNEIEGIIAGGLTFSEVNLKSENKPKNTLAIENNFSYVVATLIHGNEENLKKEINLVEIQPSQINLRNVIIAVFQNPIGQYLNDVSIKANITEKNSSEILFENSTYGMQIAPNSSLFYPTRLEGERLEPGHYVYNAKMISESQEWIFHKEFRIKVKQSEALNKVDVSIPLDKGWKNKSIIMLVSFILLLFVLGIGFRYNKSKSKTIDKRRKGRRLY